MKGTERDDTPVLITAAERSFDDQHAARKRKYLIMMALRVPFLFLALAFYQTWWLALAFVVLSIQKGEFHHANSWLPNFDQTEAAKEELNY